MGSRAGWVISAIAAMTGSLLLAGSAAGASSTSFQINSRHSGYQADPALNPPFHRLWNRRFSDSVSYPLIVGDRVFVDVHKPCTTPPCLPGVFLYALSRETGQTLWRQFLGGSYGGGGITFGDRQVYTVNDQGVMSAFGPATGKRLWSFQLPGQADFSSGLTYNAGLIYTAGTGTGQTVYAVTPDGSVAWSTYTGDTGQSLPAVGANRVYESVDCPGGVIAYDSLTGDVDWHYTGCPSGSGTTPALYQGRVYDRKTDGNGYVLNASSGTLMSPFVYGTIPAFANGQGFQVRGQLRSFDVRTGATNWTFTDPHAATGGYLTSAPLVVNDHVLVGSAEGLLYAVNATNGNLDWHDHPGATIDAPNEWNPAPPLTGFGAGAGTLVVPAGSSLVAYTGS